MVFLSLAEQCQLVCVRGKRLDFSKCCLKSIWKLLTSIRMPTNLTAILIAPKEGAALQGNKKVEQQKKSKEKQRRGAPWEQGKRASKPNKLRLWLA